MLPSLATLIISYDAKHVNQLSNLIQLTIRAAINLKYKDSQSQKTKLPQAKPMELINVIEGAVTNQKH